MPSPAQALLEAALAPTRLSTVSPRARTPRAPRGLERRYETALRRVSRGLALEVARALRPVLATATDGPRTDAELDLGLVFRVIGGLRLNFLQRAAKALPILDRFGRLIRDENAREMRRILPISISDQSPQVQAVIAEWRTENVRLITSIADRLLGDVQSLVTEASTTGMRVETLRKRLQERFRVSESRAQLIARDQILKANSDLTRARHLEAGVTRYTWITSQDEKVRDEHRDLHGQVFSWDDPPDTGNGPNHPGQDFQCRCIARPELS